MLLDELFLYGWPNPQDVIAYLVGAGVLDGSTSGWPTTTSASPPGEADGDHFRHSHTCRGHQSRNCLVSPLEPAHRRASWRITVSEQPPAARKPLGVLRVPTEYSHLQRASVRVVSHELGRADPLSLRHAQVIHHDAEAGKREANALGRGHPRRRAECEPHERRRAETHRQSSEDLSIGPRPGQWLRLPPGPRARTRRARRPDEFRPYHGHTPLLRRAAVRGNPSRRRRELRPETTPSYDVLKDGSDRDDDDNCEQEVAGQEPSAPDDDVYGHDERECEREHEDEAPQVRRLTQDGVQRRADGVVDLGCRLGDDCCQTGDHRCHRDERDVARPPVPRRPSGGHQQCDLPRRSADASRTVRSAEHRGDHMTLSRNEAPSRPPTT